MPAATDDITAIADGDLLRRWFLAGDVGDPENDAIKAELDRRDAAKDRDDFSAASWDHTNRAYDDADSVAYARWYGQQPLAYAALSEQMHRLALSIQRGTATGAVITAEHEPQIAREAA